MHITEQLQNICATGLTPNGYYLIHCRLSNLKAIGLNEPLEERVLLSTGFLNTDGSLSKKCIDTGLFNIEERGDIKNLYQQYLDCWSEVPNKLPSGKYAKSNKLDILKELRKYIVKYRHTSEMILEATKRYLLRQEEEGYTFCRTAQYFISKDGLSDLATEVENLSQKEQAKPTAYHGMDIK